MSLPSDLRILNTLHSQPKADVLLCVGPADANAADNEDPHRQPIVAKRFRLHATISTKSPSSSPTSVDSSQLTMEDSIVFAEATQEARLVQKLLLLPPYPHIVRYYDSHSDAAQVIITMEHCARGDLLTWLEQQPDHCFPEPQALAVFRQILLGVRFLHSHDIAHRDLSLENCLVAQDSTIKICDFGLATSASSLSQQHVGKLNYMAPEVVRGDLYDPVQADVWSLGVVLFMLLTGSPLFNVANQDDVAFICVQRIGVGGILKQWGMGERVSERTVDLLSAMLCIEYEGRLHNIEEILTRMAQ